jgi:hypothetical protein
VAAILTGLSCIRRHALRVASLQAEKNARKLGAENLSIIHLRA